MMLSYATPEIKIFTRLLVITMFFKLFAGTRMLTLLLAELSNTMQYI